MSEKRRKQRERISPCQHGVSRFSLCETCDFEAAPPQPSAPQSIRPNGLPVCSGCGWQDFWKDSDGNLRCISCNPPSASAEPSEPRHDGLCCLRAHANAVAPWTCQCKCHSREFIAETKQLLAERSQEREEAERAEFEAWHIEQYGFLPKDDDGDYMEEAENRWEGWLAGRAALRASGKEDSNG